MYRRELLKVSAGMFAAYGLGGSLSSVIKASTPQAMNAEMFHASRKFAKTSFGNIAYYERGKGNVALFLHGFPLNSYQWRGAIDRLSPYRRCIAADFMGLGYTEITKTQDVSPNSQVAMLISLLDQLSIKTVDLIANDSGGAVAQLLITQHPQRVRTLLLTNCDTEKDCPPPALKPVIDMSREGKFVDSWLLPWYNDKNLARSSQGIGGMCFADPTNPSDEAIDSYFRPLVSSQHNKDMVHAYALGLERNMLAGIEQKLKLNKIPTRILWGTSDDIFSKESPDYLNSVIGNSKGVRKLAGSKLFWPEERPDVIAEEAKKLWGII